MRQSSKTISIGKKDIRDIAGEHYINLNFKVKKTDVQSKLVDGVLPAGTLVNSTGIPANDATTYGVLFNEIDFNDSKGTEILPILVHGFLNKTRLKEYTNEEITVEAEKAVAGRILFI